MTRNIAIILAGGVGSRLGLSTPKQFFKVAGKMVIEHTIDTFERNPHIDEIAVVSNPFYVSDVENIVLRNGWKKVKKILQGGKERYDSSLSAIRAYADADVNLIFHDAVRPLVSQRIIDDVCEALLTHEAIGVAIPTVDTILEADEAKISAIPDRSRLWCAQTPQAFRRTLITRAYEKALSDPNFKTTDDCGVVVKYLPETPVLIVRGEESNKKLTYKEDLVWLERLIPQTTQNATEADNSTPQGRNRYVRVYHQQNLRTMQLAELDILREVARLCERHKIPYWLDSGTLLGAVRHGGFIPWDDDIDICMPKEEIEKFIEIAVKELPPHLFVQTQKTESQLRLPVCKVRNMNSLIVEAGDDFSKNYSKGLYIDIFPMESWPSLPYKLSKRIARGYCRANSILQVQHTYSWRSVVELFYFGAKRSVLKLAWSVSKMICKNDQYYSNVIHQSGNGNRHLRKTIFPLSTISFENEEFSAPADNDAYLRDLFGENYMTPPPEGEREGHATFFISELIH